MSGGWQVIALDDVEPLPGPGSLTWRPVRATLGIRAFGTNAYTANEPGVDVVEPHTEDPDAGHEELYFVALGHATFMLDGETVDAPAGTYVFVADPAVHRHAVAVEPGTTVLSFGGPATFEPSPWEWYFRAAAARDDPAAARAILDEGLTVHPDSPGMHYELACWHARSGDVEAALAELRTALEHNPELAAAARDDEDFAALRDDAAFRALTS